MGAIAEAAIKDICVGSRTENRTKLFAFEEYAKEQEQLDIPVKHYIHGGMYAREITIPAGTALTGQIYKFDHFDIMISGDITVSTDTDEPNRFTGYNFFKGLMGKKRAGYAHEDTTWITFHPFDGDNGDEIQAFLTATSFEELNDFHDTINRDDYSFLLSDMGITDEDVTTEMNKTDVIDVQDNNVYTDISSIDGLGIFSRVDITKGDIVGIARDGKDKTITGRYTNHALYPNCNVMEQEGCILFIANRYIEKGEEITVNYREVLKVGAE
jgi:hypothetical protein